MISLTNDVYNRRMSFMRAARLFIIVFFVYAGFTIPAQADVSGQQILVLDFELNDLTMNPDTSAEQKRVSTLRPLLAEELAVALNYQVAELAQDKRDAEKKGKGYIFDRPEVAAGLGRAAGAQWVVTGRLHKASFLFVYLKAQLINVESARVSADFVVEIKGWEPRLTAKGVETLALQIDESLRTLCSGSDC